MRHSPSCSAAIAGLFVAAGLLLSAPARAQVGHVTLSWNACGGTPNSALTVVPRQRNGIRLVAYLAGQGTSTVGYELGIVFGDANNQVPDAWRFDANGCQGSGGVFRYAFDHLPPGGFAAACPAFDQAGDPNPFSITLGQVVMQPPGQGYPTSLLHIEFGDIYPNTPNFPTTSSTYFLMDIVFDETLGADGATLAGTACGGLADPVCFHLVKADYQVPGGEILPFGVLGADGIVSANAPGGGCLAVPAHPATWGAIKSQYRL